MWWYTYVVGGGVGGERGGMGELGGGEWGMGEWGMGEWGMGLSRYRCVDLWIGI